MGQNVDTFLKDKNEGKGILFCYFFIFFSIILMIFHYN